MKQEIIKWLASIGLTTLIVIVVFSLSSSSDGKIDVKYNEPTIFYLNGCGYVCYSTNNGIGLTHQGNCKNHGNRRTSTIRD